MATKRTRNDEHGRRRDLIAAAELVRVRSALELTQVQLAAALGVHRRTIIRGEQRGIEIPWRGDTRRAAVVSAWQSLQARASKKLRKAGA